MDYEIAVGYKFYETIDTKVNISDGTGDFGIAYQYDSTDGFLRNNDADISSISGRIGCRLPSDGFISANKIRNVAVKNTSEPGKRFSPAHTLTYYQFLD